MTTFLELCMLAVFEGIKLIFMPFDTPVGLKHKSACAVVFQ